MPKFLRSRRSRIAALLIAAFLVFAIAPYPLLRKFLYHPRPYPAGILQSLPAGCRTIVFDTSDGSQTAFYLPPRGEVAGRPFALWVCFSGNASLALDWLGFVRKAQARDPRAAFLLVEYPGFGLCKGKPTRKGIIRASEKAFESLADETGRSTSDLEADLNVLGYSMGTGAGLEFAVRHPVRQVILLAPYTSIVDMARQTVGSPLCYLVPDQFDNRRRIDELLAPESPPAIDIFHDADDSVIPFRMGEELARRHPGQTVLHATTGAGHGGLLTVAEEGILRVLARRADHSSSSSDRSRATDEPSRE
ncbi:alpha/beta hydrolase [Candidatus Sumerlaeota bacterium]|nr:alpha/beta hydrolase [Candidatus Sumerlaeota bacterium]